MKKYIFYLLLVFIVACNTIKQKPIESNEYSLDPSISNLTWKATYDTITHRANYNDNWSGCGWSFGDDIEKPSADFSKYDQLVVNIDSVEGEAIDLILAVRYTNTDFISSVCMPIINGHVTLHLDLDTIGKSHVLEAYVMSKVPCKATFTDAKFCKSLKYAESQPLNIEDGFIDVSEFENYSDDAVIFFEYFTTGELTALTDSGTVERMDNWEVGMICSAADVLQAYCPRQGIIVKGIGQQIYKCRLGDIRYMFDIKDDDGTCGLYWIVWTIGNITETHIVKATISEVIKQ